MKVGLDGQKITRCSLIRQAKILRSNLNHTVKHSETTAAGNAYFVDVDKLSIFAIQADMLLDNLRIFFATSTQQQTEK
jgi:hypothetical protein